jgi:hypothetical protein
MTPLQSTQAIFVAVRQVRRHRQALEVLGAKRRFSIGP